MEIARQVVEIARKAARIARKGVEIARREVEIARKEAKTARNIMIIHQSQALKMEVDSNFHQQTLKSWEGTKRMNR